ncbi:pentapeptide repeat-containing protein [Nocardia camponoti]|uniref:pentapeptide repeat-containing protein n=1 Tax=Nocardia camponoti TaxID=1616106 RepID=UPI00166C99EB|nr:pentapeptide repeat-containing protein [Nocardia camponoti]
MTGYAFDEYDAGKYSLDVKVWPTDRDARAALMEYLEARSHDKMATLAAPCMRFTGADLSGMDLAEAYLFGADLDFVAIANADLNRATITGANMEGANFSGSYMHKVEADEVHGPRSRFSRANLFRSSFVSSDLFCADLSDAQLSSTSFARCNLASADMRGCQFGPSRTRLSGARMKNVKLEGAVGVVVGPVFVDDELSLNGRDLQEWFASCGAPNVSVWVAEDLGQNLS